MTISENGSEIGKIMLHTSTLGLSYYVTVKVVCSVASSSCPDAAFQTYRLFILGALHATVVYMYV